MEELIIVIAIVSLVLTIAFGFIQYKLGKKNKSNKIGMIIPIIYFVIRMLTIWSVSNIKGSVISSIIGAVIFTGIYWWIFIANKKRAIEK